MYTYSVVSQHGRNLYELKLEYNYSVLSFSCLLYAHVHCMKEEQHTYTLFQPWNTTKH